MPNNILDKIKPEHAGWLLACLSETNIRKGKKIYESLSEADKKIALAYHDECLEKYEQARRES